jgi:hypothetical protein
MPTLINQRVFFSGTKLLLRQEACEFTRPLAIGNNWTLLRVALLWAVNGASNGANSLAQQWMLGLCNGNNGYAQKYTDHFVGWGNTAGAGLTYTANSGNPYYVCGSARAVRKVGFTSTTAAIGSTNINIASTEGTFARKSMVIIDITKGASSFSVTAFSTNTSAMGFQQDLTIRDFLEALQTPSTPTVQGISMAGTTSQSLTGTESAGSLDTFNFYTEGLLNPLEIYGMAVYRML